MKSKWKKLNLKNIKVKLIKKYRKKYKLTRINLTKMHSR
jgi:hypothetical protein